MFCQQARQLYMIAALMFADYDAAFGGTVNVCVNFKWKNLFYYQKQMFVIQKQQTFAHIFHTGLQIWGDVSLSFKLDRLPFSAQSLSLHPLFFSPLPPFVTPLLTSQDPSSIS